MILSRLLLQHFRNYRQLDLDLDGGSTLIHGSNGAGKTNIVEAIFLLATTKSFRARTDRELIDRSLDALESPFPFARIEGDARGEGRSVRVEIVVGMGAAGRGLDNGSVQKRFRLNGTPRRASDVVGELKAVLFSPSDVDIILGSPSQRRRYLDLMLCQVDRSYLRLLQSYARIVQQRNGVLTNLHPRSDPALLEFWDAKLISEGAEITRRRQRAMEELSRRAAEIYLQLSGGTERLQIGYLSSVGEVQERDGDVEALFAERLAGEARRSMEQGVSLVGPHRDDVSLLLDGVPLGPFGSRGQQRTAALALRMAEAGYISGQTGSQPVLLLDEALAELDDRRREDVVHFVRRFPQVILTGTSAAAFPPDFSSEARLLHVESGRIETPAALAP